MALKPDKKKENKKETMTETTFKGSDGKVHRVSGVSMEHLRAMFGQHQHYTNCCTLD